MSTHTHTYYDKNGKRPNSSCNLALQHRGRSAHGMMSHTVQYFDDGAQRIQRSPVVHQAGVVHSSIGT